MMPPSITASILYAAWLFAIGALIGWSARGYVRRRATAAAPEPLTEVRINVFGQTVKTDIGVDLSKLETLANGCGYTLTPMPTRTLQ